MTTIPLTEAKAKLNELVDEAVRTHERVTITRHGRPAGRPWSSCPSTTSRRSRRRCSGRHRPGWPQMWPLVGPRLTRAHSPMRLRFGAASASESLGERLVRPTDFSRSPRARWPSPTRGSGGRRFSVRPACAEPTESGEATPWRPCRPTRSSPWRLPSSLRDPRCSPYCCRAPSGPSSRCLPRVERPMTVEQSAAAVQIAVVVGNPKAQSRTLGVALAVADALAEGLAGPTERLVVDLAEEGALLFDQSSQRLRDLGGEVAA